MSAKKAGPVKQTASANQAKSLTQLAAKKWNNQ